MKSIIVFLLGLFLSTAANAQYTRLIPSMRQMPNAQVSIPDYGSLIQTIEDEIIRWGDTRCQESMNQALNNLINIARGNTSHETEYVVVADITQKSDCKITNFYQLRQGEQPAVLHGPDDHILVYVIKIYPFILVGGQRY